MKHYRYKHKEIFPQAATTLLDMSFGLTAGTCRNSQGMAEKSAEIESIT
jgi:hypothetical protein